MTFLQYAYVCVYKIVVCTLYYIKYDFIEFLYVVCQPSIHTCASEVSYIHNILLLHTYVIYVIILLSMVHSYVLLNSRDLHKNGYQISCASKLTLNKLGLKSFLRCIGTNIKQSKN